MSFQEDPLQHLVNGGISNGPGKVHRPSVIPIKPDHALYKQAAKNANLGLMMQIWEQSLPESKRCGEAS